MYSNDIWLGDCLELMNNIPDQSVDFICVDLPYSVTACKWDTLISFESLWNHWKRIRKDHCVVALFGSQPFTTDLINSNRKEFKYCWYWKKSKANGWQHSKNKPMFAVEEICIFSNKSMGHESLLKDKRMRYNPQGIIATKEQEVKPYWHGNTMGERPNQVGKKYQAYTGFPTNVLEYDNVHSYVLQHPTEKPVKLLEYLIKTYTIDGELVLDCCCGSGSTLVAANNCGRKWLGIEKEREYCDVALRRLSEGLVF